MAAFIDLYPELYNEDRVVHNRVDIFELSDTLFLQKFRFTKNTFEHICEHIRPAIERPTNRNNPLTAEDVTALGLRYFASGSFHSVVGDTLHYSQSATHHAIGLFSHAIDNLFIENILFPTNEQIVQQNKVSFSRLGNFPNVIACVDGTHIPIEKPNQHEQRFVNRKGFHSINVQAMCDPSGKFINLEAKWPGSTHDSRIFQSCNLWDYMETHGNLGLILGDSAYPLKKWLMTPIRNPTYQGQLRYNYSHSKTRVIIENTFGRWKRRFPILKFPNRRKDVQTTLRDIWVAAVLHNIAIEQNVPDPQEEQYEDPVVHVENDNENGNDNQTANNIRNLIVQNYFL